MNEDDRERRTGDAGEAHEAAPVPNDAELRDHDLPQNRTPEALRALAEAEQRRKRMAQNGTDVPTEVGGRDGPDPIRYGDWEKGGIASDF